MSKRSAKRYVEVGEENVVYIGNGYRLEFPQGKKTRFAHVLRDSTYVRGVDLSDQFGFKIFIVDMVRFGAHKSKIAEAFHMSRQTIDRYLELVEQFGVIGLLSSKIKEQKAVLKNVDKAKKIPTNKSKALQEKHKRKRDEIDYIEQEFDFSYGGNEEAVSIEKDEQPFVETHNWERTRYAGVFVYLIMLISNWKWLQLIIGYSGKFYKIFMVFLLMATRKIGSIEKLKNEHSREAGVILGISRLPSIPYIWRWFYNVSRKRMSSALLTDFFKYQIRTGIISMWSLFIDGHLLPYNGKEKVHHAYYTQRRMPYPGQTNIVSTDITGKIAYFDIQEGLGDLKGHVLELSTYLQSKLGKSPLMIFDREGYGAKFFNGLVENKCPFVCWDKHINRQEMERIPDSKYDTTFEFKGTTYQIFEGEKRFDYDDSEKIRHSCTLRRIYIWNRKRNKRICGLAWTGDKDVSSQECTELILSRWGASENTFKHIATRHPFHYRPGFAVMESEKQEITNPELKEINKKITHLKKELERNAHNLAKHSPQFNKDGSRRRNSKYDKLQNEHQKIEARLKTLKLKRKDLPETIDLSNLENYKSYKKIDCEGKNLFDFVTTSVWNARKIMVEFLASYIRENEVVDTFYAITNLHGKIKSTDGYVLVKLEPLQQSRRLEAQKQLCKFLSSKNVQLPNGKYLFIEVDENYR